MLCPVCDKEGLRYGKNRNGTRRFFCRDCAITFSEKREQPERVFADRQLTIEKAGTAIKMLMEGTSLRGVCRILRIGQSTLLDFLLRLGKGCERLMGQAIFNLPVSSVQCDEIWSFVHCKEKTRIRKGYGEDEVGDCYTWTAIDSRTKLLLAYAVGKRDNNTAVDFVHKLRRATRGRFQIDTDGLGIYRSAIPLAFGYDQDHAQIVKIFALPVQGEARYSPPQIIDIRIQVGSGNPDLESASTSYVERSNLTIRMMLRRFTRLTNAHSKSWRYHEAALALLFCFYNFCRRHMTLKCTPAKAAGLTDHQWSVKQLIQRVIPEGSRAAA
jgi:IS1 family transposase/transposase-like protein